MAITEQTSEERLDPLTRFPRRPRTCYLRLDASDEPPHRSSVEHVLVFRQAVARVVRGGGEVAHEERSVSGCGCTAH
jgi:hypothetical protein